MKRLWKLWLCLAVAVSLVIGGSSFAFASDAAEDEESELSMDELLALLSLLSGDSSEDEASAESGETVVYTVGSVSFEVPADWVEGEDEEMLSFYTTDYSIYASAMYQEGEEEGEVDLSDEDSLNDLIEALG